MRRVAFYVRVSTERQQYAQTIEHQVSQLRECAAGHEDWVVEEAHIFRDDGYSGAKLNRPGLDALRDQAVRAAFDLVLIAAPDRLARNYVHQMVVLEELTRHGCQVCFVDRPLSTDPHEQLVVQIRSAVAAYERTLIADRMRRGRLAKLRSGRLLPWARAPYGYRLDPERPRDPALVGVDPAAAAIVQDLFRADAAGGVSLYGLATQLPARQLPTPRGQRQWTASGIRCLLTNPAYIGLAAFGKKQTLPSQQRPSVVGAQATGIGGACAPTTDRGVDHGGMAPRAPARTFVWGMYGEAAACRVQPRGAVPGALPPRGGAGRARLDRRVPAATTARAADAGVGSGATGRLAPRGSAAPAGDPPAGPDERRAPAPAPALARCLSGGEPRPGGLRAQRP